MTSQDVDIRDLKGIFFYVFCVDMVIEKHNIKGTKSVSPRSTPSQKVSATKTSSFSSHTKIGNNL